MDTKTVQCRVIHFSQKKDDQPHAASSISDTARIVTIPFGLNNPLPSIKKYPLGWSLGHGLDIFASFDDVIGAIERRLHLRFSRKMSFCHICPQ